MNGSAPQQRRRGRPPLVTTERIVDAGIALTLPALSMKRVAEALGVSEMTLYRHVDNLAGLRRTVAQGIWARTDFPTPSSPDPRRALLELAETMRAMASRHPGIGAYLLNLDPGSEVILEAIERHQTAWAERYGWAPERASLVVTTVTSCAVALGELAAPGPATARRAAPRPGSTPRASPPSPPGSGSPASSATPSPGPWPASSTASWPTRTSEALSRPGPLSPGVRAAGRLPW